MMGEESESETRRKAMQSDPLAGLPRQQLIHSDFWGVAWQNADDGEWVKATDAAKRIAEAEQRADRAEADARTAQKHAAEQLRITTELNASRDAAEAQLAELREAAEKAYKELDALWWLYGQNLEVFNWHRNGAGEPLDSFFEDTDQGAVESLKTALAQPAANKVLVDADDLKDTICEACDRLTAALARDPDVAAGSPCDLLALVAVAEKTIGSAYDVLDAHQIGSGKVLVAADEWKNVNENRDALLEQWHQKEAETDGRE